MSVQPAPTVVPPIRTPPSQYLRAPSGPTIPAWVTLTAGALGLIPVLALWWDGVLRDPLIGPLSAAGRLTGLLAGYAMIALTYLIARIPALERGVGADRLTAWHARLGRAAVVLTVAHVATIMAGRHEHDGGPGGGPSAVMIGAMIAILAMGISAMPQLRRALPYHVWQALHVLGYLGLILGFVHLATDGSDFAAHPVATLGWGVVLGLGLGALVYQRAIRPVILSRRHRFRVAEVTEEAPGVVSVTVTGRDLDRLRAASGQFFRWRFAAPGLRWSANPYSLSAPPTTAGLRLTAAEVGDHSGRLRRLRPGTRVGVEGPSGGICPDLLPGPHVLLIAGGMGIAPVRALAESLAVAGRRVTVIYRAPSPERAVLSDELADLTDRFGIQVHQLIGSRHDPRNALTAEAVRSWVPRIEHSDVFICGSEPLTLAARAAVIEAGSAPRRIHSELFRW